MRPVAHAFSHLLDESRLPTPDAVFRSEGDYWTLSFAGETCRLKDAHGLHYLAQLLRHPHQEFHVLTLTQSEAAADTTAAHPLHPLNLQLNHTEGVNDAGNILDPRVRAAYTQQLRELQEELEEAREFHDLGRSERLAAEIDVLLHELTQAVGFGGQTRHASSPVERARTAVTKAVKKVLKKLHTHHPALGHHLATTIKTGAYCSYTPDPRLPISWQD
jgi:non-specific serine/threonine protein kinase